MENNENTCSMEQSMEDAFLKECELHVELDFEEYVNRLHRWLILSPWHHSSDTAFILIENQMSYIIEAYLTGESVYEAGCEVGYCCG